eukprot:m.286281 g.286281  ORF g.286281 m.286281 type:complete len:655 (+) comp19437_c2_seq7:2405-4369(+)
MAEATSIAGTAAAPEADVQPSTTAMDTATPTVESVPAGAAAQDSTPASTAATETAAAGMDTPSNVAASTEPPADVVALPSDAATANDATEAEPQPDAQPEAQPDAESTQQPTQEQPAQEQPAQEPAQQLSQPERAGEQVAAPASEPAGGPEAQVTEAGESWPQAASGEGADAAAPLAGGDDSGTGHDGKSDHLADQAGQAAPTPLTDTPAAEPSSADAVPSEPSALQAPAKSAGGSDVPDPATNAESGDAAAAASAAGTTDGPTSEPATAADPAASAAASAAGSSAAPTPAMVKVALSKLPSGVDPRLVDMLLSDGSSDEEEFVGFGAEDIAASAKPAKKTKEGKKKKKRGRPSGDGGDDSERVSSAGGHGPTPDNDYEAMLMRRKMRLKRRRKDGERTDLDEFAKGIKDSMFDAAEEDKVSNEEAKPATKKLQLLPRVVKHLSNTTMQQILIENGVLQAVAAWLQPMPDRSLPSVQLRTQLIHVLEQLPDLHNDDLKDSGLGKACMLLLKHPKETPSNRAVLQKLVQSWARMVFKLHSDYKHVRLEDRMERDRMVSSKRPLEPELQEDDAARALRPGDAGFVWRARVPQPRMRDYVDRPVSNVDAGDFDKTKKQVSRLEKLQRRHREGQLSTQRHKQHAVGINMSGSFAGNKN